MSSQLTKKNTKKEVDYIHTTALSSISNYTFKIAIFECMWNLGQFRKKKKKKKKIFFQ